MSVLGFLLKIRIPPNDAELYEKHLIQLGYEDIRSLKEDVTFSVLESFSMKPGHIKRFMREAPRLVLPLAEWDVEECLQWLRQLPIANEDLLKYCEEIFDAELVNGQCIINIVSQGEFKPLQCSEFVEDAPVVMEHMKKLVTADSRLYPPTFVTPSLLKNTSLSQTIKMKSLIIPKKSLHHQTNEQHLFTEDSLTISPFGFDFRLGAGGMDSPCGSVTSSVYSGMREAGTMRAISENPVIRCTRDSLVLLQRIGGGGSGTVYGAIHVPSFTLLAVKHISTVGPTGRKEILAELRSLYSLSRYDLATEHNSPINPAGIINAIPIAPTPPTIATSAAGVVAAVSNTGSGYDEDSSSGDLPHCCSGDATPLVFPVHPDSSAVTHTRTTSTSSTESGIAGIGPSPPSVAGPASTAFNHVLGAATATLVSGNLLRRSLHHHHHIKPPHTTASRLPLKIKRPEETVDEPSPRSQRHHLHPIPQEQQQEQLLQTPEEFRCPYIVKFYDAYIDPDTSAAYVVLEHMAGGSLEGAVERQIAFTPTDLVVIAFSVLKALQTLHKKCIVHRDIKPSNILVDASGCVKLSDFGSTRDLSNTLSTETFTGTLVYMSPERITSQRYTSKGDIWSLGVTMCALNKAVWKVPTGKHGFFVLSECIQSFKCTPASESDRRFNEEQFTDLKDFVQLCLTQDPDQRPSADQLLQHRVFLSLPRPRSEVQRLSCLEALFNRSEPLHDIDEVVTLVINWQLNDADRPPSAVDSRCSTPVSVNSGSAMTNSDQLLPPVSPSRMESLARQLRVPTTLLHSKYEKQRQIVNEARSKKLSVKEKNGLAAVGSRGILGGKVTRSSSFTQKSQHSMLKATLSPKCDLRKPRSKTMDASSVDRSNSPRIKAKPADSTTVSDKDRASYHRLHSEVLRPIGVAACATALVPPSLPPSSTSMPGGLWVDCSSTSTDLSISVGTTATATTASYTTCERYNASSSSDAHTPSVGHLWSSPVREK